jgi:hypothetical protein
MVSGACSTTYDKFLIRPSYAKADSRPMRVRGDCKLDMGDHEGRA